MKKSIKINDVYYTLLNNKTKKAQQFITTFYNNRMLSLYGAYGHPSCYKVAIFDKWCERARELNTYNYGIIAYNCMMFCFAFDFEYNGKSYIAYITPSNNYLIEK